jgi:hypothetical protein
VYPALSDQPTETGSRDEFQILEIASTEISEPAMRYWQLSEAYSRMARRIKKRDPAVARVLQRISEDAILEFHEIHLRDALKRLVDRNKRYHQESLKDQLSERSRSSTRKPRRDTHRSQQGIIENAL